MAFLARCWLLIERLVIPHGFIKWFYLSFYIHPFFLPFCLVYLWLQKLLLLLCFPFRILCCMVLFVARSAAVFISRPPFRVEEVFYDAMEDEIIPGCQLLVALTPQVDCAGLQPGAVLDTDKLDFVQEKDRVGSDKPAAVSDMAVFVSVQERDQDGYINDSWLHEYLCSERYIDPYLFSYGLDDDTPESLFSSDDELMMEQSQDDRDSEISLSEYSCDRQLLPVCNFDVPTDDDCCSLSNAKDLLVDHEHLPVRAMEQSLISKNVQENKDSFRQKLTERFGFFNLLYHERLHGLRAISNVHLISPGSGLSTSISPRSELSTNLLTEEIRMARSRILGSLESDLELIYVAQTSLYWEALQYEYRQVEVLTLSDDPENRRLFHHSVAGKFQEFQILLERFVEEQKGLNYIDERLSLHFCLQVPDVTGFNLEECNSNVEAVESNQVLQAIKKCIQAFWSYITTDDKKSSRKYKGTVGRTRPTVEDPMDLELLYDVTNELQKKGIMIKHLQGKKRCWLKRRVEPQQTEDEKINLLFAMIEMRLVERVLKMSLVSGPQLKWCREKLSRLEFRQGRVFMSSTCHLFPCS